MYKIAKPVYFHVITPLHAGSGSDVGYVDLPIQREKHSHFPKIEGAGLKGSFREALENKLSSKADKIRIHIAFGYDNDEKDPLIREKFRNAKQYAGALGFSDARILLFPVKSVRGVFAWITCPYVLQRYRDELSYLQKNAKCSFEIPLPKTIASGSKISLDDNLVILEEYSFNAVKAEKDSAYDKLASFLKKATGIKNIPEKMIVLSDEDFRDFVELSTEIITRTKIDETGTVKGGALWTEEYLPAETVMYSLVFSSGIYSSIKEGFDEEEGGNNAGVEGRVMDFFTDNLGDYLQVGGNATIGKGIVRVRVGKERGR